MARRRPEGKAASNVIALRLVPSAPRQPDKLMIDLIASLMVKSSRGQLKGVMVAIDAEDGEHLCFTGSFRREPDRAAGSALRLAWAATRLDEE